MLGSVGHMLTQLLQSGEPPERLKGSVPSAEVCLKELLVSSMERGPHGG